jgi:cytochrome c oxidase subunit 1
MVAMAVGGTILFISILMFATVAIGTRFSGERNDQPVAFAQAEPDSLPAPPVLDRVYVWGAAAIVLAVLAYIGPIHELIALHPYGAPGHRTW